jgi:hypothetical protein
LKKNIGPYIWIYNIVWKKLIFVIGLRPKLGNTYYHIIIFLTLGLP